MTRALLLIGTIFLTACAAPDRAAPTASTAPADAAVAATGAAEHVPADAALATFFESYNAAVLARSPETKARRGIIDADYGRWSDYSDAGAVERFAEDQRWLADMRARFSDAALSEDSRMSYRLFAAMMERSAAAFPFRGNEYVFDQMNGAHSDMPAFLINIHVVRDRAQADAYVERLRGLGPVIDSLIAKAETRERNGVMPPDWVFPYVKSDIANLMNGAPFSQGEPTALYADLKKKVAALGIPQAEKDALIAAGEAALIESVGPAYRRLAAMVERQAATAPDVDGVHRFADGAAYYQERLRFYTTTDMTADQVHQLGLEQVARIHAEMEAIMTQVGFTGTRGEFFVKLRNDPAMFHTSRADYLAEANAKLAEMDKRLPDYFGRLPKADFIIKPVEAFREKSAGKAFYNAPTPDGSRPGTYYINLYNLRDQSKTELEALAYHEAKPGHHLQRALQVEMTTLPSFRRFGGFTAYTEGWGLYSEELGKDMGFYTDPYSDFGRLGMELWRACRLVVDTGIHHKGWSREEAIAYLTENTPNPDGDIRKAIERYTVYPGQATAYMIGKLKIMELRQRAMDAAAARGADFDWRGFHDAVLETGPVPLDVLEENIDAWIAEGA
ncbi:DUF885 domain-containing protein [Pacificimonas sp. WHA3]|uniref:DUF885 domain-containing protein n=1 Tax=Pacificimonas pallii TaxID=2827236 RepID=A0ABS6SHM7_9SPHN|nr:DUF885 domain-containing protein [Pacificimonas pallii]MBV7257538.1 DUF885 domain-containing protein [Pacificimonas pallii]